MHRLLMSLLIVAALMLAAGGAAADDDKPTIAFLRYAGTAPVAEATEGILDSFEAYGYLSSAERAALTESIDLHGANINLLYRDAGFDLATVNLMVEEVIDSGADALVTITTQVAQLAVNATRDLDDPPAILFSLVTSPFGTGIADSTCIKPAHVTGTQPVVSFANYVPLALAQNPDIQVIGTIVTPDQPTSLLGAKMLANIGDSLGLEVKVATAVTIADLGLAAESLLNDGIEALMLTVNPLTLQGTPALVQLTAEYGVPIYAPVIHQVYRGVTIAAGFHSFYEEGVIAARMLHAHLSGEVDIADIAINQSRSFGVALNLDTAAAQEIELSEELQALANFLIKDGQRAPGMAADVDDRVLQLREMSLEERLEVDREFLDGLRCTEEMIAEQQAALDAQE